MSENPAAQPAEEWPAEECGKRQHLAEHNGRCTRPKGHDGVCHYWERPAAQDTTDAVAEALEWAEQFRTICDPSVAMLAREVRRLRSAAGAREALPKARNDLLLAIEMKSWPHVRAALFWLDAALSAAPGKQPS